MHSSIKHQIFVAAFAASALFTNLGGNRLWDRDEPRNAGCAREMLARGDWVSPYFNAELRVHKPVLLYWCMMSSYAVLGETEFAARFWSALFSVGSCLLTYHLARRLFSPQVGLWSGLILATSLFFDMAGRAATPDAALVFCCTAALTAFGGTLSNWQASVGSLPREPKIASWFSFSLTWCAVYAMLGLAVLAKGPVGFVLPAAIMGAYLILNSLPVADAPPIDLTWGNALSRTLIAIRRIASPARFIGALRDMRLLPGIGVMLAVALPWYVWVGIRTEGAWLYGFLWEHNVQRAAQAMEGHRGGIWFYPVAMLVGLFPWSILAGPAVRDLVERIRSRHLWQAGYLFLTCWMVVWIAVFTLARTKLANYITPCYPAAAILLAAYLHFWMQGKAVWQRGGMVASITSLALVGIALATALPWIAGRYFPGDEWLGFAGAIPLVGAGFAAWHLIKDRRERVAQTLAATSLAFVVASFAIVVPIADRHQLSHELLGAIEQHTLAASIDQPVRVASYGVLEPSWVFYGHRPVHEFRAEQKANAAAFLAENGRYLITTAENWNELRPLLPPGRQPLKQVPYFLQKDESLVVISGGPCIDSTETAKAPALNQESKHR